MRRPRRNRKSEAIRSLVRENKVTIDDLIFPLFLTDGSNIKSSINSMPGIFRFSSDLILKEIEVCLKLGIKTFALFPNINNEIKDKYAKESHNAEGLYLKTIKILKRELPEAIIMSDVAMDPYSSDGHDGIV